MQRKNISIVVAGSGEIRDLEIAPGVTVTEVLNEAGLQGYQLSHKGNDKPLESGANLYDLVGDNEKLFATPEDVSVGSSTAAPSGAKLLRVYPIITSPNFQVKKVIIRRIRKLEQRKDVAIVGRDREMPYWKQNGWQKSGKTYSGDYRTPYGEYGGVIEEDFLNSYSFFIYDPPAELKNHKHWQCFSCKGNGKYQIHFSEKPEDISSGIITIERLISEAFENPNDGGEGWGSRFLDLLPFSWRR